MIALPIVQWFPEQQANEMLAELVEILDTLTQDTKRTGDTQVTIETHVLTVARARAATSLARGIEPPQPATVWPAQQIVVSDERHAHESEALARALDVADESATYVGGAAPHVKWDEAADPPGYSDHVPGVSRRV